MSKAFIIHWCEQLRQYNQLSGKAGTVAQFTDPVKVQMLQNTVDGVAEFCNIRTVAQQIGHTPNSGNPYTFSDYKALLQQTHMTTSVPPRDAPLAKPNYMIPMITATVMNTNAMTGTT